MSAGVRGIQTPHWPSILSLGSSVFFAKVALSFILFLSRALQERWGRKEGRALMLEGAEIVRTAL